MRAVTFSLTKARCGAASSSSSRGARRMASGSPRWEVCIGLEVHAQIITDSKLFSPAVSPSSTAMTNSCVDLFDAGHPGTLPRPNLHCLHQALTLGVALRGRIPRVSEFVRKHYVYPDLPHGYQITQLHAPVCTSGVLPYDVALGKGAVRRNVVRIARLQLETDTSAAVHTLSTEHSCIDLNRTGVPLVEIVTEPDLRSSRDALGFLTALRNLLRVTRVCACAAAQSHMRVDVNVSVRPAVQREAAAAWREPDPTKGGYVLTPSGDAWVYSHGNEATSDDGARAPLRPRVEIKNINTFRGVVAAIDLESARQIALYETGGTVTPETRMYDDATGSTVRMRSKEGGNDYRFMREPDLRPLMVSSALLAQVVASLPVLPAQQRWEMLVRFGLSSHDAHVLQGIQGAAGMFQRTHAWACAFLQAIAGGDAAVSALLQAASVDAPSVDAVSVDANLSKLVFNWLVNELCGRLGPGAGDEEATSSANSAMSHMYAHAYTHVYTDDISQRAALAGVREAHLGCLLAMIHTGAISGKTGKDVLTIMCDEASPQRQWWPWDIVKARDWAQLNDVDAIYSVAEAVVRDSSMAASLAKYKSGHERVAGVFIATVLARTNGRANPDLARDAVMRLLGPCPPRAGSTGHTSAGKRS